MINKVKKFGKKVLVGVLAFSIPFVGNFGSYVVDTAQVFAETTDYSWNNEIPVKTPSASADNGKLVLFDNTHGSTTGAADWVIDGGFSDFADALVQEGYTVKEYRGIDKNNDGVIRFYDDRQAANVDINEAVITYDGIKDADVLVLAECNRPFRQSEYEALKQFVDSGKGIFFISDHYNADRNKNTWDATEVFNGYNRSTDSAYNMGGVYGDQRNPQSADAGWLSENFGIRFRFNSINCMDGASDIRSINDSEGLTQGVTPVLMAAGGTLAVTDGTKAKGIVYLADTDNASKWGYAPDSGLYFGGEAEGPFVAISKPSLGKAAFIGDSSPIEDITPKYMREETGATKKTYDGWKDAGNAAILSVNIINWLANTESYVGFDGVNHTKGIETPTPMTSEEMGETAAEPWAAPTYDPWNTDTFAYGSYGAPTGPTDGGNGGEEPPVGESTAVFISEYIEGSGFNKAIEIYNGTDASIDLSTYSLVQYNNGSSSETFSITLSGTLAKGEVYVVANQSADAAILAEADMTSDNSVMHFNGDDAIALKNGDKVIDVIGKIGEDPGAEWGSGDATTKEHTLVRKSSVKQGDADGSDTFTPSTEWDGYAQDTLSYLGSHEVDVVNPPSGDSKVFFSEYIEGSSYNKALEIYNASGSDVNLADYSVENYSNGKSTPVFSLTLSGTLASGEVYVIANANATTEITSKADLITSNGIMDYNGDDTVVLKNNGAIVDVIGKIGQDPGSEWGTGDTSTKDNTIVRKETVLSGDSNGSDDFDPLTEWYGYAKDTYDYLGTHTVDSGITELFFSEYIEGSGYSKALEIYNGTGSDLDLSEYSIENYSNGRTTPLFTLTLSGTITSKDVFVVSNANAPTDIQNVSDLATTNGIMDYNGDDTIVLKHNGVIIDVIGKIGQDPGSEWGTGDTSTKDNTLVRKASVTEGDKDGSDDFDPALEWDGYAKNTFSHLGSY